MGFLVGLYGLAASIAGLNWALMRRVTPGDGPEQCVLIPARNEADNLARLLPALKLSDPKVEIFVFNDESDDETASIALQQGATVVQPREPLPLGWTGKNRACHELAIAAIEQSAAEWLVFLDADVHPSPDFLRCIKNAASTSQAGVITGFPHVESGEFPEPLFLGWVGWILLCTNPFGLVDRTGKGHNRFTNGQFHAWRREIYAELKPNETVRDQILEDVGMGRLLARKGVRVDVLNVSSVLSVRMYRTWREALDGMSKNSFEIAGSVPGSILVAAFLLLCGWGWALAGPSRLLCAVLLLASGLAVAGVVRVRPWLMPFLPIMLTLGAFTVLRSIAWHRTGQVKWKGRTYSRSPHS